MTLMSSVSIRPTSSNLHDGGLSTDIYLHDISYDESTNFTDHSYYVESSPANSKSVTLVKLQAFLKSQGKSYVEVESESDAFLKICPFGTNIKSTCYIQVPNTSKSVSEWDIGTIEKSNTKLNNFLNIL